MMSLLNYIAILGRQPELGLVELESLAGVAAVQPFGRQAALLAEAVPVERLGGTVKLARVLYRGPALPLQELPVDPATLPLRETKTPFALSVYGGQETPRGAMAAGLTLKKRLRARGPVRLVLPAKGSVVTAAELLHNRVVEDGFELVVVVARSEMVVAQTVAVQDIAWYSRRDYDRPARSAKVGMLPPKLAQILVNTTTAPLVVDPFCGTGVVLQEALLVGRTAAGSDLAPEMVAASRDNLAWLADHAPRPLPRWQVDGPADARTVELPAGAAVVSEGYLGPNMSQAPTPAELDRVRSELRELYRDTLRNFARQQPAGAEVSLTAPAWRVGKAWHYLGIVDELPRLGYTLKGFKHASAPRFSGPLLYARDDQVVGRQLLLLRKN